MLPRWMRIILPKVLLTKLGELISQRMLSIMSISDHEIRWTGTTEGAFYCRLQGFQKTDEAQWTLSHEPSGVQVQEFDDFEPGRVAVWGVEHVVILILNPDSH